MAFYLVTAKPSLSVMADLNVRLQTGEIQAMRPFGEALDLSLREARIQPDGVAAWEEEDYCRPPLAMERRAILDTYFTDLHVEEVAQGMGWQRIETLPSLWDTLR